MSKKARHSESAGATGCGNHAKRASRIRRAAPRGCLPRVARPSLALTLVCFSTAAVRAELPAAAAPNKPAAPIRGALVLGGGAGLPERVFAEFMNLAGAEQARLVVIPTASAQAEAYLANASAADELLEPWRARNPAQVRILHARSPSEANGDTFVAALRQATGVWFDGGDQSRIAQAYLGTSVERELHALLDRDGVIGGSSAGAAMMTAVMIAGGDGPQPEIAAGLDLLPGAIVDQHFLARHRQPRLLAALARYPGRFGLGIDEKTALVVRGRQMRVLGESSVTVILPASASRPATIEPLSENMSADLVSLSRAAIARAREPAAAVRSPPASSQSGS